MFQNPENLATPSYGKGAGASARLSGFLRAFHGRAVDLAVFGGALASILPLLVYHNHFQYLFFYYDDWPMLDRADCLGLGQWLIEPFAGEGVFPLFRLLWLGALHLARGHYWGLICILWITHAAICLLLGRLLARAGMAPPAIAFALFTFGMAWTNIETLSASMQWSAQLEIAFFLAAWHMLLRPGRKLAVVTCLFASSLCSTRGILSGAVLAVFVLLRDKGRERMRLCVLCLAPVVVMSAVMWLFVPHHHPNPGSALRYAGRYLVLNPLYDLLPPLHLKWEAATIAIFGLIKAAVLIMAFRISAPRARLFLWALVSFDLMFAASLGYARESTGLITAAGSRYQYVSLICFTPMAGILVARLQTRPRIAVTFLCILGVVQPWKRHIEQWSTRFGKYERAAVEYKRDGDALDPSLITVGRARELIRRYNLR